MRWRLPSGALRAVVVVGVLGVPDAGALPLTVDGDADGFTDAIEINLGSNPGSAASTPESAALAGSCLDGLDNDGDSQTDGSDPDCTPPPPSTDTFPDAGRDAFDSGITLDGYPLVTPFGTCRVDFDASGPTVVERSAPMDLGGGLRKIDVEIVALQLTGTATVLSDPGCALPAGDVPVTMFEDPSQTSTGSVTDTNPDPARDFTATSFFDVFFQIDTPAGVLPGGPPNGPPGAPVRVENTINGIPPYHSGQNSLCYQVPGLTHEHCPKAPPDHYKCYRGKFPRFAPQQVTLRDQFDATPKQTRVLKPAFFCNPAAKNGEPLYEATGHLKCYRIKPEKTKQVVVVRNQFGTGTVTTKKSQLLCLPSGKDDLGDPKELDHFKCYSGKFPRLAPRPVTLVDQFTTSQTTVSKPLLLCNPVDKNGEGIRNPLNHLECFKLKPERVRETVTVRNQFGEERVDVKLADMLCVPSAKTEQATTTTTTVAPTTTTTTVPTGLTVMASYIHPTPGVPPSYVCGKVTLLPPQSGSGSVTVTGPNNYIMMTTVMLDASGMGRFQVPIFDLGPYTVTVTIGTRMAMTTVNVMGPSGQCP